MSEEFKIIYKILKILKDSMDVEEFNPIVINSERLGISDVKWCKIIKMLYENGYINGISISQFIGESKPYISDVENIEITLKGLEYLEENSMMKKASELAKGIIGIIK